MYDRAISMPPLKPHTPIQIDGTTVENRARQPSLIEQSDTAIQNGPTVFVRMAIADQTSARTKSNQRCVHHALTVTEAPRSLQKMGFIHNDMHITAKSFSN
jgi:hypothetical protein